MQNAARQLEEALSVMRKYYYKKDAVDWDSIISAAKSRISTSGNCADAYETVNWCFRQMNEKHSFLMPAGTAAVYTNDTSLKTSPPLSRLVGELSGELLSDQSIAYLTVPWVNTSDPATCTRIADSIQSLISVLDKQGVEKWIIDLRKNTGGNCWPMIAGIGPLLGEGICGYFVSADEKVPIIYRNGSALQGKQLRCQVSNKAYETRHEKKWIIVLTGPRTSSSGEIVAMAFKGKDRAYLYGQATAGFTTANASYPLSDKSMLVLTICMEADRNGKIYDGRIFPDQFVNPEKKYEYEDPAKSAAVMWLQMQ